MSHDCGEFKENFSPWIEKLDMRISKKFFTGT